VCTAHAGHTQAFAVSGGAVLRMTVMCILKPLFFVENSVVKSPPNSNRQPLAFIPPISEQKLISSANEMVEQFEGNNEK